eukprot:3304739-Pyramimonas_sp.AAC.1
MATSRLRGTIPTGSSHSSGWKPLCTSPIWRRMTFIIHRSFDRPRNWIDNAALRTVLTFVACLLAGGPAMTFGYVPTKKRTLQMTSASRLSPKVHLDLKCLSGASFAWRM